MKSKTEVIEIGKVLYSPFSGNQEVITLIHGYVIAYTFDEDAKRRIHLIYGPGAYFPVLTTFNNTEQRATYESLTRTVIKRFSKSGFLDELNSDINFCNEVLRKTVDQLGIFADRVINLQITRVEDRLLHRLRILARAHGKQGDSGVSLPYKLKHHHLADMLGVERESVSRALTRLKDKDQIRYDGKTGQITVKSINL